MVIVFSFPETNFQRTMTICARRLSWGNLGHGHRLFLSQNNLAKPFSPYSIQKRPKPQICPKFVPTIVFRSSNHGDPNLSKICRNIEKWQFLFHPMRVPGGIVLVPWGCQTPAQHWIKIVHPWVQKCYPVLGLGSGERLLWHFQTPVLYRINLRLRDKTGPRQCHCNAFGCLAPSALWHFHGQPTSVA